VNTIYQQGTPLCANVVASGECRTLNELEFGVFLACFANRNAGNFGRENSELMLQIFRE
jgi:hypothetical protein